MPVMLEGSCGVAGIVACYACLNAILHTGRCLQYTADLSTLQGLVGRILAHMKSTDSQQGSFADLLLRTNDPKTGRPLSDLQLRPEIAALFFAGVDTTGHSGAFCLCVSPLSPHTRSTVLVPFLLLVWTCF